MIDQYILSELLSKSSRDHDLERMVHAHVKFNGQCRTYDEKDINMYTAFAYGKYIFISKFAIELFSKEEMHFISIQQGFLIQPTG
mgnify:CR=1 FL=1